MRKQPESIQKLWLRGGRIVDPVSGLDKETDLYIKGKTIQKIGAIENPDENARVLDCSGKVIVPGLCDMHVHLREPGQEEKETIETGCRAAMSGGFTAVASMPNTNPPIDSRSHVEFVKERASAMMVDVYPVAAITKGLQGEELTEMGELAEAGAVAFSDDGHPVPDSGRFRRALEYLKMFDRVIIEHSEDPSLKEGGHMNEGFVSTQLGIKGIPSISETVAVARNILIAEYVGSPLHIAHVSTAGSVALIREAKARGVSVTAETCPHYLVLTDEAVRSFDANQYKMNPPLRTETDRLALVEGLKDGTIDVIATDHAPHIIDDKDCEFDVAAFGIIGLETSVGVILDSLVTDAVISLTQMISLMSVNPRQILRLDPILIKEGAPANLTLLDPEMSWTVDAEQFESLGRNTPFHGNTFKGGAIGAINKGKISIDPVFAVEAL